MTEQGQSNTNVMLRNDTILGVCQALGEDFGINPTWLRVGFCLPIFWNPALVVGAYLGLGLLVAVTRFASPDRKVEVLSSTPAINAPATPAAVEERELIAA